MSLGKLGIITNISTKAQISKKESSEIFEALLVLIKSKSVHKKVKFSKFGTFFYHRSPERIGRNPKTNKSYIIQARSNLKFLTSSNIKATIN
jgi:nucleoid DNA-binding protein